MESVVVYVFMIVRLFIWFMFLYIYVYYKFSIKWNSLFTYDFNVEQRCKTWKYILKNTIVDRIRERERDDGVVPVCLCCTHTLPPSRTSLSWNNIGPEGVRALAETLRTNTTLTKLKWVECVWDYVFVYMIYVLCMYIYIRIFLFK